MFVEAASAFVVCSDAEEDGMVLLPAVPRHMILSLDDSRTIKAANYRASASAARVWINLNLHPLS